MAAAVRLLTGAEVGVATTGVAGPGPDQGVPPGTVHIAVATPDGCATAAEVFAGDRELVRQAAVTCALQLLMQAI